MTASTAHMPPPTPADTAQQPHPRSQVITAAEAARGGTRQVEPTASCCLLTRTRQPRGPPLSTRATTSCGQALDIRPLFRNRQFRAAPRGSVAAPPWRRTVALTAQTPPPRPFPIRPLQWRACGGPSDARAQPQLHVRRTMCARTGSRAARSGGAYVCVRLWGAKCGRALALVGCRCVRARAHRAHLTRARRKRAAGR